MTLSKHIIKDLFKYTEVELIYRNKVKAKDRLSVCNSEDAFKILRKAWNANRIELVEEAKILLLDSANGLIGISNLAVGGLQECVCDPRIILATALKARSTKLIIAHNHITGNIEPSSADIQLVTGLRAGGKLLRIDLVDSLIVTKDNYYSFADEKLFPK